MTPIIEVDPSERCSAMSVVDCREDEDVLAIVIIPLYGPDHNAGLDCWCSPLEVDGCIVHAHTQH